MIVQQKDTEISIFFKTLNVAHSFAQSFIH